MAKDNYFSGDRCGDFMWGKGLDAPKEKRSKVWHESEKPRFANGGPVPGQDRFDNYSEMNRIKRRERAEMRDNSAEEARISRRAHDEKKKYGLGGVVKDAELFAPDILSAALKKGGPVKDSMFNNPKLTKGGLHKSLGVPMGKDIGKAKIDKATHSKSPLIRKQAVLAENMMGGRKKK